MLSGAGTVLLGLSGCALVRPGAQPPSPTPDAAAATPDAGGSAVLGVHQALAAAHAVETDPGRLGVLAWALAISQEQGAATRTPLPAVTGRTPAPTPEATPAPSPETTPAPTPDTIARLRDALASAISTYRARAVDPATAQPLVWASMAAWATALAASIDRPGVALEPAHDRLPHPVQTVAEADQAAVLTVREVLYGVQVAGGASGLSPADLDRIRARVRVWTQLRDDLHRGLGPTPSASPTPGPAWYQVPRPPDAAAAAALVVRLESAALPILGRSLAFGSDAVRTRLVRSLDDIATDLPTWGGPLVRWPGWPDAR